MKVPVSTLVPLTDSLSFVTGAAISCGTGTAWGALRRVQLQGGETIAIFGQGPIISEPHALPAPKPHLRPF
jgi:D-arabinose 1-dehydrogenase-like Zn-dependent alcohol dehydrogenase